MFVEIFPALHSLPCAPLVDIFSPAQSTSMLKPEPMPSSHQIIPCSSTDLESTTKPTHSHKKWSVRHLIFIVRWFWNHICGWLGFIFSRKVAKLFASAPKQINK